MSQLVDSIVAAAEAKVQEQKSAEIVAGLQAAKQSAQDRMTNVQAELDEINGEIAARAPQPAEEVAESPAEESGEAAQG